MGNTFSDLLDRLADYGSIKSADFIAIALPILEDVSLLHQNNLVAFISSIDQISYDGNKLSLKSLAREKLKSNSKIFKKEKTHGVLEISKHIGETTDLDSQDVKHTDLDLAINISDISKPVYIPNYKCWDYEKGHYDPITDIFQLGQILASIAFNLDFRRYEEIKSFVSARKSLYFLNKELHPTIHSVIYEMTNLYREDRTKNLDEVITKLKNYREYNPENYIDLTQTEGFRNQDVSDRNDWILAKLKNRLFDISRRNKLLYFSEKQSFLNLTVSSVPLLLDHENVSENSLIFWNDAIQKKVIKKQKLLLNSYLEFGENRFLAPIVNKIRLEARKSQNEYGFSQLRMVIAFIHWYNIKENADERITSPLLLLPAEVTKKKGLEDRYELNFSTTEAEINPILSHYLKDLYGIELPDFVDLESTTIKELIDSISVQIAEGGTGVQLEWRQKPRIQLIHSIAKKNFSLRNKKLANRSRGLNFKSFAYSYTNKDFRPLGLQIFKSRIRRQNNALEYVINEDLNPQDNLAVAEKTRTFYQTDTEGEINPLVWEVDTCNMTIGNFNYRKMSLVRDYNEIINSNIKDEVFEQLFDELPKKLTSVNQKISLKDNYPIIASDPTQTSAIELARTGESYIIQGPPGTGKSQTITNLIADYISRDKKILFVCEKRAALDVVYHRLKSKNLDELCCLVHDSQMDKKSFIQDLKQVYSDFQGNLIDSSVVESQRKLIVENIDYEIDKIAHFHKSMTDGEVSPLELLTVLHANNQGKTAPTETDCLYLPNYATWKQNNEWISQWFEQLTNHQFSSVIADYPFTQLSSQLLEQSNPKTAALNYIEKCVSFLDEFVEFLDEFEFSQEETDKKKLSIWNEEFWLANKVIGLCNTNNLSVLEPKSASADVLNRALKEIVLKEEDLIKQREKNIHWKNKLNAIDTESAIEQWAEYNSSIFRFINPSFYRLKKQILACYDISAHNVKPKIATLLTNLALEHNIQNEVSYLQNSVVQDFGLVDFKDDCRWIAEIQKNPNKIISGWLKKVNHEYLQSLVDTQKDFEDLVHYATELFGSVEVLNLVELDKKLTEGMNVMNSFSVFLPLIKNANQQSIEMKNCLFRKRWDISDFAYNLAYKSLHDIYEINQSFREADNDSLQLSINRINALLDKYFDSNVDSIRARIRKKFLNMIRITESTAAQLKPEEKRLKTSYRSGRRILENEFGKSMRYKSIRDLTAGDAKALMTSIKPVWLMSPLSVSDVLPIDTSIFDVVIYDEASQITVEEGVPSLFRTRQTIVVGDEMQMPPTNFFSTSVVQDEDEDETENRIGISLDAESLLNQSSRKLASVMLGWHYRSRHENLISFSNAAFYQRSLLTIPDTVSGVGDSNVLAPIVDVSTEVDPNEVLKRSISFHYLENALYHNRKNRDEAEYIANVIRQLLRAKSGKSIGVVAFSMDQQSEIESALDRLAATDQEFDGLIEEEYQRIDEDQFNGLFVKNLENVQGDERDIIIMSVCYGSNANGKMLMNFGPINRRGGEKRLNVIFSRAKEHMVVVSSILANEIKNDYNEGANYFKRFLAYAKHCSDGRSADAKLVLDSMHRIDDDESHTSTNSVTQQLAKALKNSGFDVDLAIGSSHFKCDIAVKLAGSTDYILGILIDKIAHYESDNIIEEYCQKPEILKAFGWRVFSVYSKDWFEKPEWVLERISQRVFNRENNTDVGVDLDVLLEVPSTAKEGISNQPEIILHEESTTQVTDSKVEIKSQDNSSEFFERYELKSDTSNKYWQVSTKENTLTVQYGRIGNKPQEKTKSFESYEQAVLEKEKLVAKKIKKGYQNTKL